MTAAARKLARLLESTDEWIALRAADRILAHGIKTNSELEALAKQVKELLAKVEAQQTAATYHHGRP